LAGRRVQSDEKKAAWKIIRAAFSEVE